MVMRKKILKNAQSKNGIHWRDSLELEKEKEILIKNNNVVSDILSSEYCKPLIEFLEIPITAYLF